MNKRINLFTTIAAVTLLSLGACALRKKPATPATNAANKGQVPANGSQGSKKNSNNTFLQGTWQTQCDLLQDGSQYYAERLVIDGDLIASTFLYFDLDNYTCSGTPDEVLPNPLPWMYNFWLGKTGSDGRTEIIYYNDSEGFIEDGTTEQVKKLSNGLEFSMPDYSSSNPRLYLPK